MTLGPLDTIDYCWSNFLSLAWHSTEVFLDAIYSFLPISNLELFYFIPPGAFFAFHEFVALINFHILTTVGILLLLFLVTIYSLLLVFAFKLETFQSFSPGLDTAIFISHVLPNVFRFTISKCEKDFCLCFDSRQKNNRRPLWSKNPATVFPEFESGNFVFLSTSSDLLRPKHHIF